MWKQSTNAAFHGHVNGTDANRPWRLRIQLESSSFSLSFFLSFLFSSTDGNFSSHDALACPIRSRTLLFGPWSVEQSRRPAVINQIFCNLWPSSRCWRSTQLRLIYSYRERRRWVKVISYLKKKKKRIHSKTKFAGFFYWNFFLSLLISLLRGNSEFSYCRRYLWSKYIRGKKNKFTALWRDGRKLFFSNFVGRWELSRRWLILYLSPDTIQPNFKIL